MKKLRITVNGKVYEVDVQVLEDDDVLAAPSTLPLMSPLPPAPKPAGPGASPHPAPPAHGHAAGTDPGTILAPLAGTVQKVFVKAGTHVEAKTPLVLLDAMKMDTYIYAPRTGTIAEVLVEPGMAVQVRDPLLRYAAEG